MRRRWGTLIYDSENHRGILFGGSNLDTGRLNDLWALDLTEGSEVWSDLGATAGGTMMIHPK